MGKKNISRVKYEMINWKKIICNFYKWKSINFKIYLGFINQ